MLLIGGFASAIVWMLDDIDAAEKTQASADSVVTSIDSAIKDLGTTTSGAAAAVSSTGSVSQDSLDTFAMDLAAAGQNSPVSWIVPTDGSTGSEGWKVLLTAESPTTPTGESAETTSPEPLKVGSHPQGGTPLGSALDDVARSGLPTVTQVTDEEGNSRLVILEPVTRPAGPDEKAPTTVGVIATTAPADLLSDRIAADNPGDVRFRVSGGSVVLAESSPPPSHGITRRTVVGDRTMQVQVEDVLPVNHDLSWFILWMTAVVVVATGIVGIRSIRYDRERRATTAMISGTAVLAQRLARAPTAEDVATTIGNHIPQVFGARLASFGEVDADLGLLHLHHGTGLDATLTRQLETVTLASLPSMSAAVSSGSTVILRTPSEIRRDLAGSIAEALLSAGVKSVGVLPLSATDRTVTAIVGILWWDPPSFDSKTLGTLETVRELCEQSLERAERTDRTSARASHLAEMAERLAGVDHVADAARTAISTASGTVEARSVMIAVSDHELGRLRLHDNTLADQGIAVDLSADADTALARVARSGIPALFHDAAAAASRYPDVVAAGDRPPAGGQAVLPLRADETIVGSMAFEWDHPVTFSDDLLHELTTVVEITAQSIRRTQLIEDRVADARRSEALSQLAQGLAGLVETTDIAEFLCANLPGPFDALHAVVGLVERSTMVRRYSEGLIAATGTDLGPDPTDSGIPQRTPATDAFRTNHMVFLGSREEARARFPELSDVWAAIGVRSCVAVPIRSGTGDAVATFTVMWDRPMMLRDELRDMLSTVAGMVGQTLERTGLVDELRVNVERFESLAEFAQQIATVHTTEELTHSVSVGAAEAVSAVVTELAPLRPDGTFDHLAVATPTLLLPSSGDAPVKGRPSSTRPHPALDAMTTKAPVILADERALSAAYSDETARALSGSGLRSAVYFPLLDGDGGCLAVLAVGWDRDQRKLAGAIRPKVRTLAELCAQTLQRVRLGEAEHRVVTGLQERVVRPAPEVEGLRIAQRYLPAAKQVGMGGDWYEGIPIDENRVAVVVGDIAGHGIGAVVDMVELRAVVGSLLRGGTPLGEVFARVTAQMRHAGGTSTATSCIVELDTADDSLRYVSAGHLPPVLAHPDGRVELLEDGRQPLLGISTGPVLPGAAPFPPGSLLVLYTDGIVERRTEPIDASLSRLQVAVGSLIGEERPAADAEIDVEHFADELLRRCLGQRQTEDDVALVVIGRERTDVRPATSERALR